ncbi:MAG: tRNA (adenosine(37)-N6)-dimethylallyltransferase MiaA [Cyclobacteriaceae bacterium]|nr:tRNA (adenosine(37)-N6)-dimethylallyltransferase MiaA [Cyclobacteriaceae bacterium]
MAVKILKNNKLIVISGPTAVGKTNLSIKLAKKFDTAIISADARQIYKELSIGTAKPTKEELSEALHYFIDIIDIKTPYSAGDFERDAVELCSKLFKTNNKVIVCGGSGLYINALCYGFNEMPKISESIRTEVSELLKKEGVEKLQLLIREKDPEYYSEMDINNPRRLSRALEIIMATGKKYSSYRTGETKKRSFSCIHIGLQRERDELYSRINQRVDQMMAEGLEEEARSVYEFRDNNALQTVGYKELFDYFDGLISRTTAIELIKQNSRRYAKRQMTWFKKNPDIKWFHPDEVEDILGYLNTVL